MKSNKVFCVSMLIIWAIFTGEAWSRGQGGGHGSGGSRGHSGVQRFGGARGHIGIHRPGGVHNRSGFRARSGIHSSGGFRGRSSIGSSAGSSRHSRGLQRFGSSGSHGAIHSSGGYRGHSSGIHRSGGYRKHHGSHGHSRYGFYFGLPLYGYPYYPYSYYRYSYPYPYSYPPAVVTVPSTPPVYIEQSKPAMRDYPAGYWYYCANPEGYYPYVNECPAGWQQVEPAPPTQK